MANRERGTSIEGRSVRLRQTIMLCLVAGAAVCGSVSAQPLRLLSRTNTGSASAFTVADGHAYVAQNQYLQVYSLADPFQPCRLGDFKLVGSATQLVKHDTLLFCVFGNGSYTQGMEILSVAVPASPRMLAHVPVDSAIRLFGVAVHDTIAYATYYYKEKATGGMYILSVKNPSTPVRLRDFTSSSQMTTIGARDTVLYVRSLNSTCAYSIADPVSPTMINSFSIGLSGFSLYDTLFIAHASNAMVDPYAQNDVDGFIVYSIADPRHVFSTMSSSLSIHPFDMVPYGSGVLIADRSRGLLVCNTAGSNVLAGIADNREMRFMEREGDFVYAMDTFSLCTVSSGSYIPGQFVAPCKDLPRELVPACRINAGGWINMVELSGDYVYTVNHRYGSFRIFNVSDRRNPVPAGSISIGDYPRGMTIFGTCAAVTFDSSIKIIDVGNPAAPAVLKTLASPPSRWFQGKMYVCGNKGYVLTRNDNFICSMRILDLTDPRSPSLAPDEYLGSFPPYAFYARDTLAYAANVGGVRVFDISTPGNPATIAASSDSSVLRIFPYGDLVLILGQGFLVRSLSSFSQPLYQFLSGFLNAVCAVDDRAFVAYEGQGMMIFDISDPMSIHLVQTYSATPRCRDVSAENGYCAIAAEDSILMFDYRQYVTRSKQPGPAAEGARTSPTRLCCTSKTRQLRLSWPFPGHVAALLYAMDGRTAVRRGNAVASGSMVEFDFGVIPNGVYCVRVWSGKHSESYRMSILSD